MVQWFRSFGQGSWKRGPLWLVRLSGRWIGRGELCRFLGFGGLRLFTLTFRLDRVGFGGRSELSLWLCLRESNFSTLRSFVCLRTDADESRRRVDLRLCVGFASDRRWLERLLLRCDLCLILLRAATLCSLCVNGRVLLCRWLLFWRVRKVTGTTGSRGNGGRGAAGARGFLVDVALFADGCQLTGRL